MEDIAVAVISAFLWMCIFGMFGFAVISIIMHLLKQPSLRRWIKYESAKYEVVKVEDDKMFKWLYLNDGTQTVPVRCNFDTYHALKKILENTDRTLIVEIRLNRKTFEVIELYGTRVR